MCVCVFEFQLGEVFGVACCFLFVCIVSCFAHGALTGR
jgi:hypothetical protein